MLGRLARGSSLLILQHWLIDVQKYVDALSAILEGARADPSGPVADRLQELTKEIARLSQVPQLASRHPDIIILATSSCPPVFPSEWSKIRFNG